MMPPETPIDPPVGDVTPFPGDVLTLGGGRWLTQDGLVIPKPLGEAVGIEPNTIRYWEAAALRGSGVPLSELLV